MHKFDPRKVQLVFETVLAGRGLSLSTPDLPASFAALFDFYQDMRPAGRVFELHEDADMLLFQWGIYYGDQDFSIDLTRQLILSEEAEDEDIWQLGLTFWYPSTDALRSIGIGNKWCQSLAELPEFRDYVLRSGVFAAVSGSQIRQAKLEFGCAG